MDKDKIKEIYDYALNLLDIKLERKHHLEIKSLYVLQATAILITLFLGFKDKIGNGLNSNQLVQFIVLRDLFFISVGVTLVSLLLALLDKIVSGAEAFCDLPSPETILDEYPDDTNTQYQEQIIRNTSDSIDSADGLIKNKIKLFNIGLILFIVSIGDLILMGFIFYN